MPILQLAPIFQYLALPISLATYLVYPYAAHLTCLLVQLVSPQHYIYPFELPYLALALSYAHVTNGTYTLVPCFTHFVCMLYALPLTNPPPKLTCLPSHCPLHTAHAIM